MMVRTSGFAIVRPTHSQEAKHAMQGVTDVMVYVDSYDTAAVKGCSRMHEACDILHMPPS